MLNPRDFLPLPPWEGPPIPEFLVSGNRLGYELDYGVLPIPMATRIGEPEKVTEVPKPEPWRIPERIPAPPPLPKRVPVRVQRLLQLGRW